MNSWLKTSEKTVVNKIVIAVIPVKNPEIPVLKNYVSGAAENFWKTFPSKEMPTAAVTKINIDKLEQITREKKGEISSVFCVEQSPEKHSVPEIWRPVFSVNLPP